MNDTTSTEKTYTSEQMCWAWLAGCVWGIAMALFIVLVVL